MKKIYLFFMPYFRSCHIPTKRIIQEFFFFGEIFEGLLYYKFYCVVYCSSPYTWDNEIV